MHRITVRDVPVHDKPAKGAPIGEAVVAAFAVSHEPAAGATGDERTLFLATARGGVKRVRFAEVGELSRVATVAALDDGDRLVAAVLLGADEHVALATRGGKVIRFAVEEVRVMGRPAGTIAGLRVQADDEVIWAGAAPDRGRARGRGGRSVRQAHPLVGVPRAGPRRPRRAGLPGGRQGRRDRHRLGRRPRRGRRAVAGHGQGRHHDRAPRRRAPSPPATRTAPVSGATRRPRWSPCSCGAGATTPRPPAHHRGPGRLSGRSPSGRRHRSPWRPSPWRQPSRRATVRRAISSSTWAEGRGGAGRRGHSLPSGPVKLGLVLGYWSAQPPADVIPTVQEAERLGFDSVWTAESWGSDAFSPAVLDRRPHLDDQAGHRRWCRWRPARRRPPPCTPLTIDHLSGGRMILGLGVSGPQVVEGWYGRPYQQAARPHPGVRRDHPPGAAPARARSSSTASSTNTPTGATTPGARQAAQGHHPPAARRHPDLPRRRGPQERRPRRPRSPTAGSRSTTRRTARRSTPTDLAGAKPDFEIAALVNVTITDDVSAGLWPGEGDARLLHRRDGGQGRQTSTRTSWPAWASRRRPTRSRTSSSPGKRDEAIAAVPEDFADEISLVGPSSRIKEKLEDWDRTPVTTLIVPARDPEVMRVMAELVLDRG